MAEKPGTTRDLARRAVHGTAWTLPTSLASRGIGLIGTLLIARYLAPAEYGDVSAASIITVSAASVTTFGVGMYLVANRDISRKETFHATCWFLATGVAAVSAALWWSEPLGRWAGAPGLNRLMPLFAAAMVLERVIFIPERMLVRELRFKRLAIARAAGELIYTAVSVGLAALGFGAVSLAWGTLARAVLRFGAIVPAVKTREWLQPQRFHLKTMMTIVGYGIKVSLAGVASFAMRRWDNLLVGRYFGAAAMGAYNYAYNLADTPAVSVGEQMSDVIAASFPHVNEASRASAVVKACRLLALVMFPLAFGLGAVAPTVVETFFNAKWANVGAMLVFLCVLSAVRPIADVVFAYFYASGRPTLVMVLEWINLAAIVVGITAFGNRNINLACAAVGGVFVLRMLLAMFVVQLGDGVRMTAFLAELARPLLAASFMVAAVVSSRPLLAPLAPAWRLVLEIVIGGIVYGAAALLFARSLTTEFVALARSMIVRRRSEPVPLSVSAPDARDPDAAIQYPS